MTTDDPNTRDLLRIAAHLRGQNITAARAPAEALAPGPDANDVHRCATRTELLVCDLPLGHSDLTEHDHYDTRRKLFFRVSPPL